MAVKSGSFQSNNNSAAVNEGWGIRVDWEQLDNSYNVHVKVYFEFRETWADLRLNNSRDGTITIDGSSSSNLAFDSGNYSPGRRDMLIGEYTRNVGSAKSFTISAVLNVAWTLRGESVTSFSASGTVSTDSIMESPNAPTSASSSLSSSNDQTINISWSHSATTLRPVDDFELQERSRIGTGSWSSWAGAGTYTNKSASRTSRTRGTTYGYQVRARNGAGSSSWASAGSVTIPFLPPNTPTLSSSQSGTTVSLTWTITTATARPISSFELQRRTPGGSWSTVSSSIGSGTRSYSDASRTRGTTYEYRIRASGSGGDSSYSGIQSQRIPFLAPNKPGSVSVERSSHSRFVLSWTQLITADRPVSNFDIYRRVNGGSFSLLASSVSSSSTSYNDNTVKLGEEYQYYLIAKNVDHTTTSDHSNSLVNPAGVPVYNGSEWHIRPVYVYNGSTWQHRSVYVYNGSVWHWRG